MNTIANRKLWSELASTGIVVAAGTFLFFEIIRSLLPYCRQTATEQPSGSVAWLVAGALGLSLLVCGIVDISISGARLLRALRKADASFIHAAAKEQFYSVVMVVAGFWLTGMVIVAGAFLFFDIIRLLLPYYVQIAIERPSGFTAWLVAAALGLSLLVCGIGWISFSAVRLFRALRKADASLVHAAAKNHLWAVLLVVASFWSSVGALFVLSQILL